MPTTLYLLVAPPDFQTFLRLCSEGIKKNCKKFEISQCLFELPARFFALFWSAEKAIVGIKFLE